LTAGATTVGVAGVEWDAAGDEHVGAGSYPTLQHQVNRLATLISKLERSHAIKLDLPEEDKAFVSAADDEEEEDSESFVIVSTEYDVIAEQDEQFMTTLKAYIKATRLEDGSQ